MLRQSRLVAMAAILFASILSAPARAQFDILGGGSTGPSPDQVVAASGEVKVSADGQSGKLAITAKVAPGWYIYSLTQKPGGPVKSKIVLETGTGFEVVGNFAPTEPPKQKKEPAFDNLDVETHSGSVTWIADLKIAAGTDPSKLEIRGHVLSQACNAGSCLPPSPAKFLAKVIAAPPAADADSSNTTNPAEESTTPPYTPVEAPATTDLSESNSGDEPGIFRSAGQHITLRGQLRRVQGQDGKVVAELILRAEPDSDWHVYAFAKRDPVLADPNSKTVGKPTLIVVEKTAGLKLSEPMPSEQPIPQLKAPGEPVSPPSYSKPVHWTIQVPLPEPPTANEYTLAGLVGFQVCHDRVGKCDPPGAARFQVTFPAVSEPSEPILVSFAPAKAYLEVARMAEQLAATEPEPVLEDPTADLAGLPWMLALAFGGGLILNLMPCVLPVIGLKVLSFVEQAGQKRHQILMLNVWYTLGILIVFWLLAALAVTLNLGWGQHFSSTPFNVVLCSIIFIMALSFLGVWEIPIPGFVGGSTASKVSSKEGPAGAISKGIVTTLLATPCSGPMLGSVFGFTLNQPPAITFALFTAIGLGMAGPYLVIGAFPALVKRLPKPGVWMETFKQAMGFVLLGTVVFLFTFMNRDYVVATFALLVGLWAACWWIGRIPFTAPQFHKTRSWIGATAFASLVGLFAFNFLVPTDTLVASKDGMPWEPFSRPRLAQLSAEGKTVMVDFTADWCLTCKMNLKWAIDTKEVRDVVKSNEVVPLLADWTDGSDEIAQMLRALKSKSIPVLAIFPAGSTEPIILRDLLSEQQVIDALKKAGPSGNRSSTNTTVMVGGPSDRG